MLSCFSRNQGWPFQKLISVHIAVTCFPGPLQKAGAYHRCSICRGHFIPLKRIKLMSDYVHSSIYYRLGKEEIKHKAKVEKHVIKSLWNSLL